MTKILMAMTAIGIAGCSLSRMDGEISVYVATDGDDRNPGTIEEPFATLLRARDAIRAARADGGRSPATVSIAPGIYQLQTTVELDARDSGVTFQAAVAGKVRLSGGVSVDFDSLPAVAEEELLKRLPDPVRQRVRVIDLATLAPHWQADSPWPDAFRGYAGWPEVVVDGQPLRLARWPNRGYARIEKVVDRGSRPRHQEKPDRPGVFRFKEADPATWSTDQEIYLGGYWCFSWYDEILRVQSIDADKKQIHFAVPHHYGIGGPSGGKYYAINVLETLDQPGEYAYCRRSGKIYLLPPSSVHGDCTVSLLKTPLVHVQDAADVRFRGLVLESGRQAGIEVSGCRKTIIEDCVIRNFPGTGVMIHGGHACGVSRSELYGLGKGGISLRGGERASLAPAGHFVTDCEIHHYARLVQTYQPAVSLNGVGNRAAYNYIHHAPHQALNFSGNDHLIEHNRIEEVCLDTADAGAIYCGRDWTLHGNVVQKNWFSRLGEGDRHRTWAVYPDDQASGVTARHNVVVDCPSGFLFGGGRDSVIEENLFVNVGQWPIRFDKRGIGWNGKHEKILQKRLAAVPSGDEPWRSRFPSLVGLATNPKRNWPAGNYIRGNIAVESAADNIDPKVAESGTMEPTLCLPAPWQPHLENGQVIYPDDGPDLPPELQSLHVGPRTGENE